MDTSLYSLGAAFADDHPELVDDVVAQAGAIEAAGLEAWAKAESVPAGDRLPDARHRPRAAVLPRAGQLTRPILPDASGRGAAW